MNAVNTYFETNKNNDAVLGELATLCGWTNDATGKKQVTDAIAILVQVSKLPCLLERMTL